MEHYKVDQSKKKVDQSKKWDYENGFYLTCETGRIGKFLNHLEVYKKILTVTGDVLEFGVYKGSSIVRMLSFRELLENSNSRKIIGFDAFGKFPDQLSVESDVEFVQKFEGSGGYGISKGDLEQHLQKKDIHNFQLVEEDILKTLPDFLSENPAIKIALIHIDVDVYEPTKVILDLCWERLVPGGILMLDDYGKVEGETKAVDEFFKGKEVEIKKPPYYHIPSYIIKK